MKCHFLCLVEKSNVSAHFEQNKIQQMPQHAQNHGMEEMPPVEETVAYRDDELDEGNEKPGKNSSFQVPIHPSSSQGQGLSFKNKIFKIIRNINGFGCRESRI
jgi:hypothetical protein